MASAMVRALGAALLYGICSILITTVNKSVLTTFSFPSFNFVGLGQIVTTLVILGGARGLGLVHFPAPSKDQFIKVFPLPVFYILSLVLGLGSTQKLNLPMFTVLRRFSLLFISIGQVFILNRYESWRVNASLVLMILGALVAAMNDITYETLRYVFVFLSNVTTAASNLYSKKKLNSEMTKYEIMFYNAFLVVLPTLIWSMLMGDISQVVNYSGWSNPLFLLCFSLSCALGFVLVYSQILVTQLTSPLTLAVIGCIKLINKTTSLFQSFRQPVNVVVTYGGMLLYRDYVYEPYNFAGINLSVIGSLLYSFLKYRESDWTVPQVIESPPPQVIESPPPQVIESPPNTMKPNSMNTDKSKETV